MFWFSLTVWTILFLVLFDLLIRKSRIVIGLEVQNHFFDRLSVSVFHRRRRRRPPPLLLGSRSLCSSCVVSLRRSHSLFLGCGAAGGSRQRSTPCRWRESPNGFCCRCCWCWCWWRFSGGGANYSSPGRNANNTQTVDSSFCQELLWLKRRT